MTDILLRNFALLDVGTERLSSGYQLLIKDGLIARLEKGNIAEKDAQPIDLGGRVLMPGLIDCHVHLTRILLPPSPVMLPSLSTAYAAETLHRTLLRGFTTIRDAAGADLGHKQAIELGLFKGPRLFIAGRALSQTGGHGDPRNQADSRLPCDCSGILSGACRLADGVDEVRRAVRDEIRLGADHIKVMAGGGVATLADPLDQDQYSEEELRVAVQEASRAKKYVMAHVYTASGVRRCVEAGVRTIEHGSFLDEATAKLMRENGTFLSPTLYVSHLVATRGKELGYPDLVVSKAKEVLAVGSRALDIAQRAGLKICFSTDLARAPDLQSEEFILRAQIMRPADIIKSATLVGAEVVGMTGKIGVIAAGAVADLIAIDGNPLESIALLAEQGKHMPLIIKDGQIAKNALPGIDV